MTTTGAWMAYGLVISGLLTVAALLGERAARNAGRPVRSGWIAALAGSLLLPVLAWLWPNAAPGAVPDPAYVVRLPAITIVPADSAAGSGSLLLYGWLVSSLVMMFLLALSVLRLRRLRRDWREAEVDGEQVLLSDDIGPAVVGLRRARIVMPDWALEIDRELRRMLLLHEREHMRAHDPLFLAGGLVALVIMPWNPFAWVQFYRLRLAIELDCDARVLRASGDARGYGNLLIEVGRQRSGGAALALAFGEPRSFLEERIRELPRVFGRRRLIRAGGLAAAAVFVLLLAVCARDPMSSVNPTERAARMELEVTAADRSDAELMQAPTFTPFTTRPELRNREQVSQALERNYPPLLRDAGIGGEALVWFFIDRSGTVARASINRSAGYPALDSAALQVARTMEFTAAENRGAPVPVWVAIPIVFMSNAAAAPAQESDSVEAAFGEYMRPLKDASESYTRREGSGEVRIRPAPDADATDRMRALRAPAGTVSTIASELGEEPTFTPLDVRPELTNRAQVARMLTEAYPADLREAGISGETTVWFLIDSNGRVMQVRVQRTSGNDALDQAALRVAQQMTFTPAKLKGAPVPVWVAIPIVFSSR